MINWTLISLILKMITRELFSMYPERKSRDEIMKEYNDKIRMLDLERFERIKKRHSEYIERYNEKKAYYAEMLDKYGDEETKEQSSCREFMNLLMCCMAMFGGMVSPYRGKDDYNQIFARHSYDRAYHTLLEFEKTLPEDIQRHVNESKHKSLSCEICHPPPPKVMTEGAKERLKNL